MASSIVSIQGISIFIVAQHGTDYTGTDFGQTATVQNPPVIGNMTDLWSSSFDPIFWQASFPFQRGPGCLINFAGYIMPMSKDSGVSGKLFTQGHL